MEAAADEGGLTGMQRAEALALLRTTLAIRSKLILQNPVPRDIAPCAMLDAPNKTPPPQPEHPPNVCLPVTDVGLRCGA